MTRSIILIIPLLWHGLCIGQRNNFAKTPPQPPTRKEAEMEERNHHCAKQTNKSLSTRLKNYPFNLSVEVQLVSFKENTDTVGNEIEYGKDSLPRLHDSICYSKLSEIKALTFAQVDSLTDIFYNYGYLGKVYTGSMPLCYNPRNAILFIDKNGKAFEFIEICFECERIKGSSEKISLGEMCDEKLNMIKNIFKNAGIEYGITKGLLSGIIAPHRE